ncbi:hypothetical protein D2V04_16305 [Pelagerythrobacter aerophilus]|uniref:Uncharacterized protein n=1 Tax=Pelagerythrobacter aerophilus TaxID=2306995 RepID=A0A418NDK4_9SPHN|nr:hypothetical protein D2V04_16305 [Pelagerythrobacter aerophilus]
MIVFSPNSTFFQLDPPEVGGSPLAIRAGQIIVQNYGRKSATKVQLVAEPGTMPWGYNLFPALDHAVRRGARGEWILELEFLGPGENVTVQILNGPQIASVRSLEGAAKAVPVIHQRLYPRWVQVTTAVLMAVGVITIAYGIFTLFERLLN